MEFERIMEWENGYDPQAIRAFTKKVIFLIKSGKLFTKKSDG